MERTSSVKLQPYHNSARSANGPPQRKLMDPPPIRNGPKSAKRLVVAYLRLKWDPCYSACAHPEDRGSAGEQLRAPRWVTVADGQGFPDPNRGSPAIPLSEKPDGFHVVTGFQRLGRNQSLLTSVRPIGGASRPGASLRVCKTRARSAGASGVAGIARRNKPSS